MDINKAIDLLLKLRDKQGNVEVFFDCQYCGKSTRPDVIVAVAMVSGKSSCQTSIQ